jgi:hypothetical protein
VARHDLATGTEMPTVPGSRIWPNLCVRLEFRFRSTLVIPCWAFDILSCPDRRLRHHKPALISTFKKSNSLPNGNLHLFLLLRRRLDHMNQLIIPCLPIFSNQRVF